MKTRIFALAFAAGLISLATISCGGGGASGILAFAPEGKMTLMLGANPKMIIESDLFERVMDEIEQAKEAWDKMVDDAEKAGVLIEDLTGVAMVASHTENEAVAYLVGGVDFEEFVEFQEDEFERDLEEKARNGATYFTDENRMNFLEIMGGMAICSTEDVLKGTLDAAYKGEDKLSANEKFVAARALIDPSAAMYGLAWDEIEIDGEDWRRPLALLDDDTEVIDEVIKALEKITAAGISVNYGRGISGVARIKFDDEDDAEVIAEFIDEKKDKFFEIAAPQIEMFASMMKVGISAEDVEKLSDALGSRQVDDVVEITFDEDDLDWLIESIAAASAEAKKFEAQNITARNIQRLGQSVEQYRMDHPGFGPPRVSGVEELMEAFIQVEIFANEEYMRDGWGNLLIYQFDPIGFRNYTIMSYGADGAPGPAIEPDEYGELTVTKLEEDIIWSNGGFSQRPAGRY